MCTVSGSSRRSVLVLPSPLPPASRCPTTAVSSEPTRPPIASASTVTGPRVDLRNHTTAAASSPTAAQMIANRPSAAMNASVSSGWIACGATT